MLAFHVFVLVPNLSMIHEFYQLARNALLRAELLIQQKQWDSAERIVSGVLVLYGTEPGAETLTGNASQLQLQIENGRQSEQASGTL